MPDKNFLTPDSVFGSVLARACDLKNGIALALSTTCGSDSATKMFSLVGARVEATVIRPLREALAAAVAVHVRMNVDEYEMPEGPGAPQDALR